MKEKLREKKKTTSNIFHFLEMNFRFLIIILKPISKKRKKKKRKKKGI